MKKPIRVELNLSSHCVQTALKKKYDAVLRSCLKQPDPDPATEDQLELLKQALENFDFPRLRAQYPPLAGNYSGAVTLVAREDSQVALVFNDREVVLPPGGGKGLD